MNPGIIILKFSAEWCKPCQTIKQYVHNKMKTMPKNALCITIDIDESLDLYSFLKQKKMLRGVPSLLCYHKNYDEDHPFIPKHSISGSNTKEIDRFFHSCEEECKKCIQDI